MTAGGGTPDGRADERHLREQHRAIVRVAREVRAAVGRGDAAAVVAPLRLSLATLLRDHFADEQVRLIDPLLRRCPGQVPRLDEVRRRAQDLRFAYSSHVSTWTARAVAADPAGYGRAIDALMVGLEAQVAFEEAHLFAPGFRALAAAP